MLLSQATTTTTVVVQSAAPDPTIDTNLEAAKGLLLQSIDVSLYVYPTIWSILVIRRIIRGDLS